MNSVITSRPANKISSGRIALLLVLGAETVFFITLLVAYIALRDEVSWNVQHTLARLALPLLNTFVLLVSAVVVWASNRAVNQGHVSVLRNRLLTALVLGLVFVAGQMYEFNHAGLKVDDPAFGGVFFTLMGFHAVHVIAGVVFLALNYMRASMGDFSAQRHEPVQLGGWFWYYVTAVWFVLFTALYLV